MNEIVKVMFRNDELEAIPEGAKVHLPIRRFCEVLGIDPDTQGRRLKADGVISTVIMTVQMPGSDQAREVLCIELRDLPLWLAKIHPSKVKASVRTKLIAFQREAAEVLAEHFFGPRRSVLDTGGYLEAAARTALDAGDFKALALVAGVLGKLQKPVKAAPKPSTDWVVEVRASMLEIVAANPGINVRELRQHFKIKHERFQIVLSTLIETGEIVNRGAPRRAKLHIPAPGPLPSEMQ